tara:strand:+ start:89 stop:361 length:273 start_codon:yes stop_codon:yes gene_type:complete
MSYKVKKEIESVILLALVKCVSEQCSILKDQHKLNVKRKFNKLLSTARAYEREIDNVMEQTGDFGVETVYDTIMETINESKEKVYDGFQN